MAMDIPQLRRKADAGSCVNQCVLGLCYLYGQDVQKDYAEAFHWLSLAAEQGASRAVLGLADMHAKGLGVTQNVKEAIRLYEVVGTPTDSSDAFNARLELARIFSQGLGVPANPQQASKWYSALLELCDDNEDAESIAEAKAYLSNKST